MSSLKQVGIERSDHPSETIRSMRKAMSSAQRCCDSLLSERQALNTQMNRLRKGMDNRRYYIDASAMKVGMRSLPYELRAQIFLYATEDLGSTIALSHVSRQFRSWVIDSRQLWQRFVFLSSKWRSEMILMVAERSAPRPLKATIEVAVPDPTITESVYAILSLASRLETLSISFRTDMSELLRCIQSHDFSNLQNLTWRSLHKHNQTHSRLIPDIPSLQNPDVGVITKPSRPGSLVRVTLDVRTETSLKPLMNFLSSASMIRELSVRLGRNQGKTTEFQTIVLPNLVLLRLSFSLEGAPNAKTLAQKIYAESLRKLRIDFRDRIGTDAVVVKDIMRGKPTIRELEMSRAHPELDLSQIPQQVEVLTLRDHWEVPMFTQSKNLKSHHIRLVRIVGCAGIEGSLLKYNIESSRDAFVILGRDDVQLEFQNCEGVVDGTFNLCDIDVAFVGNVKPPRRTLYNSGA